MSDSAWKMYVFRDGKDEIAGTELLVRLRDGLCRARSASEAESEDHLLAALIAAGELECALLDAAHHDAAAASEITDELAHAFLTGRKDSLSAVLQRTERWQLPDRFRAAVQEGFAYYALHPRKLAMLLDSMLAEKLLPHAREHGVGVLGIRSIGLTLSAVVCAALALRGIACRRTSVRPSGHPYDRRLEPGLQFRQWLADSGADFLVVDEGPGISGSSFLAVAEAVEACGVAPHRIHMIGSRQVSAATLLAPDAARRWPRYPFHTVPSAPLPPDDAGESLTPCAWQKLFRPERTITAGSWTALDPPMYLSRDRQSTFCFAGFGHFGEGVCARARSLAEAGFAPRHLGSSRGFRHTELIVSPPLQSGGCSPELLARIAAYVALRSEAFSASTAQSCELEAMLRWNWQVEFGVELGSAEAQLKAERVAICDGQMMPEQWVRNAEGAVVKLDAGNHGDNHFFPGPCDIAWDLAGCILEWELWGEAREAFLGEYTRRSGDAVTARLAPYLLAYTTFRMAYARMAAAAMQGTADEEPLRRDYLRYRAQALRLRPAENPVPCIGREHGEAIIQPGLPAA